MSSKSRVEQILLYGLGRESTLPPELSRIEELLVEYITSGGGGGSIDVDDEMSSTSTNPVQNKVIKAKFDALDGTGAGSIQQKIAFAIAEIVADAPQDFDTLKEIADWISSHEDSAAAMNSAIQQNTTAIAKKPGEIVTGKQYTIDGETVTADVGAEAFNNLANNKAAGPYSHAEGHGTTASGPVSHTEGYGTTASGVSSHAEGVGTTSSGNYSHAEGSGTKASSNNQHVQGKYNVEDSNDKYAFIIGNGTSSAPHNAFAIDWSGLIYVNGASTGVDVNSMWQAVEGKVDKVSGKGLSTEDYTTTEKTKLAGLSNYDDAALTSRVSALETTVGDINTILEEVL